MRDVLGMGSPFFESIFEMLAVHIVLGLLLYPIVLLLSIIKYLSLKR